MPQISAFYGIVIYMYFDDHAPPHFHALYGEYQALFSIQELGIIKGKLPPLALGIVIEWASQHQKELMANWERAVKRENLLKIAPLA